MCLYVYVCVCMHTYVQVYMETRVLYRVPPQSLSTLFFFLNQGLSLSLLIMLDWMVTNWVIFPEPWKYMLNVSKGLTLKFRIPNRDDILAEQDISEFLAMLIWLSQRIAYRNSK